MKRPLVLFCGLILAGLVGCVGPKNPTFDCSKFAEADKARFENSVREYLPAIEAYVQKTRGWNNEDYYVSTGLETDQARTFVVNYRVQERCVGRLVYSGSDGRSFALSIGKKDGVITELGLTE